MYDFLVIGAGICGLQLSALLSNDGHKVCVLEKSKTVGGRARVVKQKGYTLDYGIHMIRSGRRSALGETFRQIGEPVNFRSMRSAYLVDADGKSKIFPSEPISYFRSNLFGLSDYMKVARLMASLRPGTLQSYDRTSVEAWFEEKDMSPALRRFFTLMTSGLLVNPYMERASAGEMLRNLFKLVKARLPNGYPAGGWQSLFDTLTETVNQRGEVRTGSSVREILVEDGRARGARLDGEVLRARNVVAALPAQQLFTVLDPSHVPVDYHLRCTNLRPSAGISIDYCLDRALCPDRALWLFWEPIMLTLFTSNFEPALAPAGGQIYTVFCPAGVEVVRNRKAAHDLQSRMEEALRRKWPGLEAATVHKRTLYLDMVDGIEVNIEQIPCDRPGYTVPGVESLFLVGDSTCAPGGGGDIGHESVRECYEKIRASL